MTYCVVVLLGYVHEPLVEGLGEGEIVPLYHIAAADLHFYSFPVH